MSGRWVALVLAGRGYGSEGAAIRIPILALTELGADVRVVPYARGGEATWQLATEGRWSEIVDGMASDVAAAIAGAARVTVVAKSLGTAIAPHLRALLPPSTEAIWLTPLLDDPAVSASVMATGWRSLLVAGGGDGAHVGACHEEVVRQLGAESLVVPGADHRLEVPGDVLATVDGLRSIAAAVRGFAE